MSGRLIGASLGPGDPGLITRASWQVLTNGSAWAYPISKPGHPGYALAIAQRAGLTPPGQVLELHFPMVRDQALLAGHWQAAAQQVLTILQQGEDVVFLVEGDASSYATFGHLARTVTTLQPEVKVTVIPGVSSPQASAARIATPLAENEDVMVMLPATRGMAVVDQLLDHCNCMALLKIRPVLDELLDLLERRGLLPYATFVERVGTPEERIIRDVA
ncbi:MAG: precorrin-2 C(20)-methyltransferase, partial [Magnetococcales bacterium]|nr:precorrin-2 C(20)-methyltransferase [Magnetococcales bacterium]